VAAAPEPAVVDAEATAMPEGGPTSIQAVTAAVGQLLGELLRQLEPVSASEEAYRAAQAQLSIGLNWYELVPTLEQVCLVVLSVLEHDRGQFQHFLLQLNQKLAELHQALARSRQHQQERASADSDLDAAVRGEVSAIQNQVVAATSLDQLKKDVATRLDSIVGAMDSHRDAEQARQAALQQQLDLLGARVREMEEGAARVEQRVAEQRQMALRDPLTQLPNRLAYDERMQQEFERWQRYQRPLAVAICDADNFKSVNDSYGHLAGDKVLRILAATLRNRLRKTDFVARYGGEEFVVVMPETDGDQALLALEALRQAVAECPFHFREEPVSITLSIGIASFRAGDLPDAVFERADAALYRAKQAGRNRCLLANEVDLAVT
jgi:diguanylate cyclase